MLSVENLVFLRPALAYKVPGSHSCADIEVMSQKVIKILKTCRSPGHLSLLCSCKGAMPGGWLEAMVGTKVENGSVLEFELQ